LQKQKLGDVAVEWIEGIDKSWGVWEGDLKGVGIRMSLSSQAWADTQCRSGFRRAQEPHQMEGALG
jgi:hypothetical protein